MHTRNFASTEEEAPLPTHITSAEDRSRAVLDVLSGRQSVTAVAAQLGVTRQTVHNWRAAFLAAGAAGLAGARAAAPEPPEATPAVATAARVEAVAADIVGRLRSLGDAELDFPTLEAVRRGSGLTVARFCALIGIPRRTYYARRDTPVGRAAPARDRIDGPLAAVAAAHPDWGARRIWRQLVEVEGVDVSLATVKRTIAGRS